MDANLLEAISEQDAIERRAGTFRRAALKDIVVYGRVRCAIKRPTIIPDNIADSDGYYTIVDVYALKCLGEDYFGEGGEYNMNHVYCTRGSLIVYLKNPEKWIGKDVRVLGKSYGSQVYGTVIRRQGSQETTGITAFVFDPPKRVGNKTVYTLCCNKVEELAVGSRDCQGTVLEEFMVKLSSAKNNEIPYGSSLNCIIPFTGVESYTEIPLNIPVKQPVPEKRQPQFAPAVAPVSVTLPKNGERIDTSKIDMRLVFHLEGQPKSEFCDSFAEDISRCGKSREKWVSDTLARINDILESEEGGVNIGGLVRGIKDGFITNVASSYDAFVGHSNTRYREYVNKFISYCEQYSFSFSSGNVDAGRTAEVREGCMLLKAEVFSNPRCMYGNNRNAIDSIPAISDITSSLFSLYVISVCTGVSMEDLTSNYGYASRNYDMKFMEWLHSLICTPYFMGLISSGLDLVSCDCLYYGITQRLEGYKNFIALNKTHRSYISMLNTLSSVCEGSNAVCSGQYGSRGADTFVPSRLFRSATMVYDKRATANVEDCGYPKGSEHLSCLRKLFRNSAIGMSESEKKKVLGGRGTWFSEDSYNELIEIGAINTLEHHVALEGNIEQEFAIYSVFEALGKVSTGISAEEIMSVVDDFEEKKGFKLEPLQREGVKLCMKRAGVLSGCAGSGKTTTSDCLTEVLRKYLPKMEIIYCTPTGKACRRLAEVVGGTVKTIHSQFRLGLGSSVLVPPAYSPNNTKGGSPGGTIYIMDEMAMCSTDLMFNVAKNITKNDMIYFLGDVKQLPPVGNGCPFKVLMGLLPCVELGVSKRAAAGSLVNYNTSLVNFLSDGIPAPLLYDKETFLSLPCSNVDIQNTVVSSFIGFMCGTLTGKAYEEDDIQVITGYQKETKVTATSRLNRALQAVLRKNDRCLFVRERRGGDARPYYLGDRIIYINSNSYDTCRYIPLGNGVFKTVVSLGIVNGDVGKLVGVVSSEEVSFLPCKKEDYAESSELRGKLSDKDIESLFSRREERKDSIRDNSKYKGKDLYFVIIKLYDTDLCRDVLVFLQARGKNVGGSLALSGGDLDNLDLAYALTCHKMQGSQSPVVIIPLEQGSYAQFINRNMINTMMTRSQGVVAMIGDIEGNESALQKGRRCVSATESHDLLSVLTGNMDWVDECG